MESRKGIARVTPAPRRTARREIDFLLITLIGRPTPCTQGTSPEQAIGRRLRYHVLESEGNVLHWSLVFLVIALVAAILGFSGIAGTAVGIAKILFVVFLVVWLITFFTRRR
jgi:uncharacterized membrane protein YtjA (UPF0391 family)